MFIKKLSNKLWFTVKFKILQQKHSQYEKIIIDLDSFNVTLLGGKV